MAKKAKSQPKTQSEDKSCDLGEIDIPAEVLGPVKEILERENIPPNKIPKVFAGYGQDEFFPSIPAS